MALCQLINQVFQSPDVCFRTIRDFLAAADGIDDFTPSGPNPGPGYEIVDESYNSGDPADTTADDWCVLKSKGEAGTYPIYLHFKFGTNYHRIGMYLGWDATAHRGIGANIGYNDNIYHNGAGLGVLYIHADLDEIHIVIKPQNVSSRYWCPFGRLKPDHLLYDGTAVLVAGVIAAGTDVTITLPSWPGWAEVGRKIYSWDEATGDLNELEITAASETAGTITVAQAWARAAGSWLAEDLFCFVGYDSSHSPGNGTSVYGIPRRAGTSLTSRYDYKFLVNGYTVGVDGKYGRRLLTDILVLRGEGYESNGPEMRGRLALARQSFNWLTPSGAQGVAMTDEAGQNWRLYTVYSDRVIAFREAY